MSQCLNDVDAEFYVSGIMQTSDEQRAREHILHCKHCELAVEQERLFRLLRDAAQNDRSIVSGNPDSVTGLQSENWAPTKNDNSASYHVLEEIYRGGQGIVYRAIQVATNRTVALKVLLAGEAATEAQQQRFLREIDIAASLCHRNIVTIYDSGYLNGRRYLAMEFVQGKRLDQHFRPELPTMGSRHSLAQIRSILRMVCKIATAVGFAHMRGVVHRDLKPSNIIVDDELEPHILDFGLAKQSGPNLDEFAYSPTLSGEFVGTLAYASPEQTSGNPSRIDIRTDVYSLAVILYELLTGQLPFPSTGPISEVLENIARTDPPRPSRLVSQIDSELETILLKALAKDPERRYQSGEHMARDLTHYLNDEAIDAKRDSNWYLLCKSLKPYRAAVVMASILVFVISASLAVSLTSWRQAVRQRNSAIAAGRVADQARGQEEIQRREAEMRRNEAEVQRLEAEYQAYLANIAAADGAVSQLDVVEAWARLSSTSESMRGWEWHRLIRELDDSRRTIDSKMAVNHIALSPDGKLIAASSDQSIVKVWEARTGILFAELHGPARAAIAFSPNGEHLAVAWWNGTVNLWNVQTQRFEQSFLGPSHGVNDVQFSRDGTLLAAAFHPIDQPGSPVAAVIWQIKERQLVQQISVEKWHIARLAFSPNGRTLATARFDGVSIWDVETGALKSHMADLHGNVQCVAWSNDGQFLATGGGDNLVHVWSTQTGDSYKVIGGHRGAVRCAAFTADDKFVVTGSRDKTVRISSVDGEQPAKVFLGHRWMVTDIALHSDGLRLVSGSWDQSLKHWDSSEMSMRETIDGHRSQINSIAFIKDKTIFATASWDHTIKLWDANNRRQIATLSGHEAEVHGVAFSPDGSRLASCGWNGQVFLWDVSQRRVIVVCEGHDKQSRVHAVAFSPNGKWFVTGSSDNSLRVWDSTSGRSIATLSGHDDHIHSVSTSPDGNWIASAGHNSIKIWDSHSFALSASFPRRMVQDDFSLAWHPNGRLLAAGSSISELTIWDVIDRKPVNKVIGHSDEITSVVYMPDGSRLVSAAFDGQIIIWDSVLGRKLATLSGLSAPANTVVFSSDGRYLVAGLQNGHLKIWEAASAFQSPSADFQR